MRRATPCRGAAVFEDSRQLQRFDPTRRWLALEGSNDLVVDGDARRRRLMVVASKGDAND